MELLLLIIFDAARRNVEHWDIGLVKNTLVAVT